MPTTLLFASLLSVQSIAPAQAQAPAPRPPALVAPITDAVFVSAPFVAVPLSRVTDSVEVIGADKVRARQAESIADALRAATGLGVTMSGGRGAVASIFTRGGESDYTLVLVDGIPLNEFGGGLDLDAIEPRGREVREIEAAAELVEWNPVDEHERVVRFAAAREDGRHRAPPARHRHAQARGRAQRAGDAFGLAGAHLVGADDLDAVGHA